MFNPFGRVLDDTGLRTIAALLDRPIHAVDVGCRDGIRAEWKELGPYGSLVGFEPDGEECARLNAAARAGEIRYEPIALAASSGQATLYLTADPQSASLYPPSEDAVRRHPELWRHEPRGTTTVATTTLDEWAADRHANAIDVLKIDVQGAELDVLRGAEPASQRFARWSSRLSFKAFTSDSHCSGRSMTSCARGVSSSGACATSSTAG
jgi:FkbM family methyltransferase